MVHFAWNFIKQNMQKFKMSYSFCTARYLPSIISIDIPAIGTFISTLHATTISNTPSYYLQTCTPWQKAKVFIVIVYAATQRPFSANYNKQDDYIGWFRCDYDVSS